MEKFDGFTAIYERGEDGWIVVTCPEISGAISQGRDMEEARDMIRDAVQLFLETNREEAEKEFEGRDDVVRETLVLEEVGR